MRFLMVYALLRCHVRNTLKRGAFWRPSGPDTPARFTPRATWSSLELTRVGDHCGPGRHQEFFFGPTKRHCIRPGVAGGRGAATMARGALETGKTGDIAELHFMGLPPKLRVVHTSTLLLLFYLTLWCSRPSRSSFSAYFSHVRLASGAARLPIRQPL